MQLDQATSTTHKWLEEAETKIPQVVDSCFPIFLSLNAGVYRNFHRTLRARVQVPAHHPDCLRLMLDEIG